MARHSCGHKAGPFTPSSAVRAMPRCTDCQARAELAQQLDKKVGQLALLFPTKSADQISDMLFNRSSKTYVRGLPHYNVYQLIAAADSIMSERAARDLDSEVDYVEASYYDVPETP